MAALPLSHDHSIGSTFLAPGPIMELNVWTKLNRSIQMKVLFLTKNRNPGTLLELNARLRDHLTLIIVSQIS